MWFGGVLCLQDVDGIRGFGLGVGRGDVYKRPVYALGVESRF